MKKVLIIGGNSYIGNSFIQYIGQLEEKQFLIDKISVKHKEWEQYDFTGYDTVIHLAGIAHERETRQNAQLYYRVNRDLAISVAKKAKKSKVGQFIFMSTAAVYGSNVSVITKDTLSQPNTHYGRSKLEAEQKIIDLNSDEFKVAIVRPPMVYGYGCKGNFERLVKLAKITPIFPDIQNKRSMIYIENLCEFLRLLIDQSEWGYFHPQNEEYVCTSEMVRVIGESLGRTIYFTKAFNWGIKAMQKKIGMVSKIFGDLYYEVDEEHHIKILEIKDISLVQSKYSVVNFKESIHESIERK
ncbi:UDP-glucose 4-epimerase [Mobilisporobacter senegalensis]|uniref:UDP-glucose 4-epimerase n=1 Tax=Mobilisporobacter senegalensis TaxID=1329262 RepID=A0A3N1XY22_9FIRM|nr:NAD-dependent epimerase/dehydratase family protein [Mobilisporobacter senegalensis]ROR31480.1 UDP-glucose 4-epimerase [Mobilisporobacter senegalensis]